MVMAIEQKNNIILNLSNTLKSRISTLTMKRYLGRGVRRIYVAIGKATLLEPLLWLVEVLSNVRELHFYTCH